MSSNQDSIGPRQLFNLPSSEGINASERILTALCRKTFLRLWSQTNVFTDEGFKGGKGSSQELCDALVIFGNDIIIFSDKHITYQVDREVGVAWPRWYKRAVLDSCKQLHGALGWLKRFPERAFLDARCTRKLAVAIPPAPRFHLVAVTRGSREAVLKSKDGVGLGSFDLNSSIEGQAHLQTPFVIGLPEPIKHFVHVFDEVAIDLVLGELDTAADFIDYLAQREALLGRRGSAVLASGEEELLASFLQTIVGDGTQHAFIDLPETSPLPDAAFFQTGIWASLTSDPGYARKKQVDSISYKWDRLIDRFLEYGDPGAHGALLKQTGEQSEQGLRLMAAENRYRRRQLAESLFHAMHRVEPGGRIARTVYSGVAGESVYVFVILAKRDEEAYETYRKYRTPYCTRTCSVRGSRRRLAPPSSGSRLTTLTRPTREARKICSCCSRTRGRSRSCGTSRPRESSWVSGRRVQSAFATGRTSFPKQTSSWHSQRTWSGTNRLPPGRLPRRRSRNASRRFATARAGKIAAARSDN